MSDPILQQPPTDLEEHTADLLAKAQAHRKRLHVDRHLPLKAPCKDIGSIYGAGVGLYFKSLQWLQFMFLWMFVCTVPFLLVINITKFTDAPNRQRTDFGYKVHPSVGLNSFTFSSILDDNIDKGMLRFMKFDFKYPFMDTHPWIGKAAFLTWISALDAGATLVFVAVAVIFTLRMDSFAERIDRATHEVADYTVVVRGLPSEATSTEVGEHFARWGRVMDVVLIKDLGAILEHCSRMASLQQDVDAAEQKASFSGKKGRAKKTLRSIVKLQTSLKRINHQIKGTAYPARAAFVTFNGEHEKKNCLLQAPSSWLGSIFMRRLLRFNGQHLYWVRSATPPEDYVFENLGTHAWWRRAAVQLSVAVILLLCGGAITKLQSTDRLNSTRIPWDTTSLLYAAAKGSSATAVLGNSTSSLQSASLFNLSSIIASLQGSTRGLAPASNTTTAASSQVLSSMDPSASEFVLNASTINATYASCYYELPGNCTAAVEASIGSDLTMEFGRFIAWNSTVDYLLKEGSAVQDTKTCFTTGVCKHMLSSCYPCYCLGMYQYSLNKTSLDRVLVTKIKSQCSDFVMKFDARTVVIRVGISASVWAINTMLQLFLKRLVLFEKVDSRTSMEKLYAVYSFIAQLVNSTAVLLLVSAGHSDIQGLGSGQAKSLPRWLRTFIMNGSYTDFTPGWYEDVGVSLMVLLFINALLNPLLGYLPVVGKALHRSWVFRHAQDVTPEELNYAAVGPKFMLHERMASIMLDVTLAMIFGSGMPLMYGAVLVGMTMHLYIDRHILLRCARKPNRYNPSLPRLVGKILPFTAVVHCTVGVWMHTFYRGTFSGKAAAAFASGLETFDSASSSVGDSAGVVKGSALWLRVTQANGILLIILLFALVILLLVRLTLLQFFGVVAERIFKRLLAACCLPPLAEPAKDAASYTDVLLSQPRVLQGLPTYRVEHHPQYEASFRSFHYRLIWDQVYGRERYTRLVAKDRRRNTFDIIQDLILYEEDAAEQAVVVADPQVPGRRHRVTKEGMENLGSGEISGIEPVPDDYIMALRAVSFSDGGQEGEGGAEGAAGEAQPGSIAAVLQPYGAPWLSSDAGLHRGWESAARGAELEMTDVAHEEDPCDDDCSPYAPGAATAEEAQDLRALTLPGGASRELPGGAAHVQQPAAPQGAAHSHQAEAAEASREPPAAGPQEEGAASAGPAAIESTLAASDADGESSFDQVGDAVALQMASVSSQSSSVDDGDGAATAAAPAGEQLLAPAPQGEILAHVAPDATLQAV